jgi:hypothetical protein
MTRFVFSLFALALAVSFSACEGHPVAELPPHYQHKLHHDSHGATEKHPEPAKDSHKDPNAKHDEEPKKG